jgi:hypothetical protein
MRYNRLLTETVRELRALGFDPKISNGGKHKHLHFINAHGVPCRLTFSQGPGTGSFRIHKNHRANLRRMLRAGSAQKATNREIF